MEDIRSWYPYESGRTIGKRGPAGGTILADEEFGDIEEPEDADARVTLESDPSRHFLVTVNLYGGWLQETATYEDEHLARDAFETSKNRLLELADAIPDEEEKDMESALQQLNDMVSQFTAEFGGEPTL